MNSSAITNSIMPTVSIPGSTASESAGSGFGDVMASITENWSERKNQTKIDAAKSAQSTWDDHRAEMRSNRNTDDTDTQSSARNDDRHDDEPLRADRNNHEDHLETDDPKPEDKRDVENSSRDTASSDNDTQHVDSENSAEEVATAPDDEAESLGQQKAASSDDEPSDATNAQAAPGIITPNQPAATVPLPGSQQAIDLAKAKAVASQSIAGTNAAQDGAAANGQANPGMATNGAAADGTTDGLMSSTALSQPATASSAKLALNGADAATGDDASADKFLSRLVDSMSGDGKAKTDASGVTNATANSQSSNATTTQTTATGNPAQTAQAAQQAMAAAASAQNMQNNAASTVANGTVTATGATDATPQAGTGQLNTTNNLHQTNTSGHTAQTARHAPAQQVQQQVAVSIKNAASDGVDKISVQLRPEHLGRVDVKLEIGHDGRIQGVIQADTRETLDMLRQDSRALQQALKDAGLNADSQSFTFEHRDQGGQGQEGQSQSRVIADQGSSPDEGDILSGAELAEHVGIGYGINPNGLVDIRI
ncbi:flagellar hook-length control protein FliK [Thalassospira sp. SM2505]|nr:flagellar hook-length control protein FliK [Thalassospira profundimaris]